MSTIPCHFTYTFPLLTSSSSPSPESTTSTPETLSFTHPIPPSLLSPPPPTHPSSHQTYQAHLLDILTTVNHLHHSECLAAITRHTPCCAAPGCANAVTDALKAPVPMMLGAGDPMVATACVGVCGGVVCEGVVRGVMMGGETEWAGGARDGAGWGGAAQNGDDGGGCAQCGRGATQQQQQQQQRQMRKCGGCGVVRYCGERCQRKGWKKGHRWECQRVRGEVKVGEGGVGGEDGTGTVGGGEGKGEGDGTAGGKGGEGVGEEVPDPEDEIWEE